MMRQHSETQTVEQHAKIMDWALPGSDWTSDVLQISRNKEQHKEKLQTTIIQSLQRSYQKSDFQSQTSKHN